ncbi:MAG: lamin tail domain-containing protein, partial [Deltaproteobacteria bacterium]|nr:lamin tail domain-containing protein [Deltaproteobacteria bacterium]
MRDRHHRRGTPALRRQGLALALVLVLAACGSENGAPGDTGDTSTVAPGDVPDAEPDDVSDTDLEHVDTTRDAVDDAPSDLVDATSDLVDADLVDAASDLVDAELDDTPPDLDADTLDAAQDTTPEACTPVTPWSRKLTRSGGTLVFTELRPMLPGDPSTVAWLELGNLMSVSVDLSGWRLAGAARFTFPEGTRLAGGARLVVAVDPASLASRTSTTLLGPMLASGFTWSTSTLELRTRTDRLMDTLTLAPDGRPGAPWPSPPPASTPAGSVPTLVKRDTAAPSALGESWTLGAPGGTPGASEPSPLTPITLVAHDATWRFTAEPTLLPSPPSAFATPDFDDRLFASGLAPFASTPLTTPLTARFTADNHFALYVGPRDASALTFLGRDTNGDWTSAEDFAFEAGPDDHLFVAAWESPGDSGSPQMLIGEVARPDGSRLGTAATTYDAVLAPANRNPALRSGSATPTLDELRTLAAASFSTPAADADGSSGPWGGAITPAPVGRFIWVDTFGANSLTNQGETFALFRSRAPVLGPLGTRVEPHTHYLRTTFTAPASPSDLTAALTLATTFDGGLVVYLNGLEVLRDNLPAGPLDPTTEPLSPAPEGGFVKTVALPTAALRAGLNVLAVEVHPGTRHLGTTVEAPTLRFEGTLALRFVAPPSTPEREVGPLVFSEIHYHPIDPREPLTPDDLATDWIELTNPTDSPVDVADFALVDGVRFAFPTATTLIAPHARIVLVESASAFATRYPDIPIFGTFDGNLANAGERLTLRDACGRLVDTVRYADGGRWPERADGGGSTLELRDLFADNAAPDAWQASAESSAWQVVRYRATASASKVGPDGAWEELVIGLLDAGEVLLDDVRVIEDPDGAKRELVAATFDTLSEWRALGTHADISRVTDPDDPSNPVLRLVATGPTEHMHNQLQTTLKSAVVNGRVYEISLRARWLGGSDLLNTRLYFNRLARTTHLARPLSAGTPGRPNGAELANPDGIGPTFADLALDPVVPRSSDPVKVTVTAHDPDGIDTLTLVSRADDGPAVRTPMLPLEDQPALPLMWTATLPPSPAGTVVQLWIEGRDLRGQTATFPALGPASRALYRVDDNPPTTALPVIRILMTPADVQAFHAETNVMSNALTRVTILSGTHPYFDVGVRAKGSERGRPVQNRLGFALRFDPLDPFRGAFTSVSLDRSEGVVFGQRELLMDLVMAGAGSLSAEYNDLAWLVAPRPEQSGPVLLQTARFSDLMLDAQFANGSDGNLYEYELVYYPLSTDTGTPTGLKLPQPDSVVGTALRDLGPDPEAYRHTFLVKNNRAGDDHHALIAMLQVFSLPEAAFQATVDAVIDVDQWLRAFAFMAVSGAVDHFGGGAQHNAQLYVRPSDERVLLFPHDLDFYPGDPYAAVVQQSELSRLLRHPGARRTFYGHLHELLTTTYDATYLAPFRDELASLVPSQPWASHVDFMAQRATWILKDASDGIEHTIPPTPFAITTNGGQPFTAAPNAQGQ